MRSPADLVRDPLADIAVLELAVESELSGGVRPADEDRRPPRPGSRFVIHDLRHTFASTAVAAGQGLPMIGKLLGHT
jgi:integrase